MKLELANGSMPTTLPALTNDTLFRLFREWYGRDQGKEPSLQRTHVEAVHAARDIEIMRHPVPDGFLAFLRRKDVGLYDEFVGRFKVQRGGTPHGT